MEVDEQVKLIKLKVEAEIIEINDKIFELQKALSFQENLLGVLNNEHATNQQKLDKVGEICKESAIMELIRKGAPQEVIDALNKLL